MMTNNKLKKRKINIDPKIGVFLFCAIFVALVSLVSVDYHRYQSFLECSEDTKVVVNDKRRIRRRSGKNQGARTYNLIIRYSTGDKLITRKKRVLRTDYNKINIGDTLNASYACEYPKWIQFSDIKNREQILIVPKSWLK